MNNHQEKSVVAESFYLESPQSKEVVILVHGLTGSPADLRTLGEFLHSKGLSVFGVKLAGHGSSWENLAKLYYYDWWKSVEEPLHRFIKEDKNIFLIGYSFGGSLVLEMANKYQTKIKGVVTLGISVYLKNDWLIRLILPLWRRFAKYWSKTWIDDSMRKEYEANGYYSVIPVASLEQMYKFIDRYTKKEIKHFKPGVLLIHSSDDRVNQSFGSLRVYEQLKTSDKELFIIDSEHHVITQEQARKSVIFNKIYQFINNHSSKN